MSVKDLFENGTMTYLLQVKAVTPTVFRYKEIDAELEHVQKSMRVCKTEAVTIVASRSKVSERFVWNAISFMKK